MTSLHILSPSEFERVSVGYAFYQKNRNEIFGAVGILTYIFANFVNNIRSNFESE